MRPAASSTGGGGSASGAAVTHQRGLAEFLAWRAGAPPARARTLAADALAHRQLRAEMGVILTAGGDAADPDAGAVDALQRVVVAYLEGLAHAALNEAAAHPVRAATRAPTAAGAGAAHAWAYRLDGTSVVDALARHSATAPDGGADFQARTAGACCRVAVT